MTSAEQGQLQVLFSPSFASSFIGGGIFESKGINLSPQLDDTSLAPVQILVFTQAEDLVKLRRMEAKTSAVAHTQVLTQPIVEAVATAPPSPRSTSRAAGCQRASRGPGAEQVLNR